MRVLVLSIIACLAAPEIALAQHRLPNPFRDQAALPVEDTYPAVPFLMRYREERIPSLREGNGFRIPLGSVSLVGQGTSYYPADNQKVRNESLHVAWPLSDHTDMMVGAWRFKHRHEGLDDLRVLSFGIGARYRF